MKYTVNNIRVYLADLTKDNEKEILRKEASKKLGLRQSEIKLLRIIKESVDARKKPDISIVYTVLVEIINFKSISRKDVNLLSETHIHEIMTGKFPLVQSPVIIGAGPAGLFSAWLLAEFGFKPVIIERGADVDKRTEIVNGFWTKGILDEETNVQFGEGGAGTFSDGKLTTRINDSRCNSVLKQLYKFGAPEEILFQSKPHIGTDRLKSILKNMRKAIEKKGGKFLFENRVDSIRIKNGSIIGVETAKGDQFDSGTVIMAIGHSARDTFKMLFDEGVAFRQKAFSVGVRIEHSQEWLNKTQYGKYAGHFKLGSADYQLVNKLSDRTAYTFCMCPGGRVVASASEPFTVVTNGMSELARDGKNSNSALVVSVKPGDFGSTHPLAGMEFQRELEKSAYDIGGESYAAPVQRLGDFIMNRPSKKPGIIRPSYTGDVKYTDLNNCLPSFVTETIKESIGMMDRKLRGFAIEDAMLTGVETRTSSPVRIPRNEDFESVSVRGLYPAGEGAGYAGGIMSAAVDGMRVAEKIINRYYPDNIK